MEASNIIEFPPLSETLGKFHLTKKKVLIPEMNRMTAHLFAATFRSFGIEAQVLRTYGGLDLGKKYTSGKECYPCQVTLGDILCFVKEERERLGPAFSPEDYIYFMPESEGPCRFGLYNKYQRIVLDSFPGLKKLKISSVTTKDGYSLDGLLEKEKVLGFKKAGFLSVVVADILDRLTWRVRPYEKEQGMTDAFMEQAMHRMAHSFETCGVANDFDPVLSELDGVLQEAKGIIDPKISPKPLIGIVGEIFLRMHRDSNQDLIKVLEKYGAEVENASMSEWVNYVSYAGLRQAKKSLGLNLRLLRFARLKTGIKDILNFGMNLLYQETTQKAAYKRAQKILDLAGDHKISHLEETLNRSGIFSFDVSTEACLSIASIISCGRAGYNGMVNVYPFTCMPSTTTSAVVKPLMSELGIPYLDAAYDSSIQPGREAAIRTFMYQAEQHFRRHGRMKNRPSP